MEYLFREWEMERDPEEMIRESMAPVRQAAIGPMLVAGSWRKLTGSQSKWMIPD